LRSLTKSQTFKPNWFELGLMRAEYGPNGEKTWFSRAVSGLYGVYIQLLLIKLVSSLN